MPVLSEPRQDVHSENSDPLDHRLDNCPSSAGQAYAGASDDGHRKGDDSAGTVFPVVPPFFHPKWGVT